MPGLLDDGVVDEVTQHAVAAAGGDRWALGAFVRQTQADVWRFCAHLVDGDAADDLTQDTYVRAVRSLGSFRAESSGRTWLLSIARRACADEIRRRQRRRRLIDRLSSVDSHGGQSAVEEAEWSILVRNLEPERRSAFVLTQLLGLRYHEAAEVCGCPIGTIRSRVARARTDLVAMCGDGRDLASGTDE